MKTILITLLLLCILTTQNFSQWQWLNPRPHGNANNRIAFGSNSNTYTIVGAAGMIIKTTDDGVTWQIQYSGTDVNLNDIYISGDSSIVVGNGGTILRTTDGGSNWSSINSITTTNLTAVAFATPTIGIITGWNGLVLRSNNGGLNWSPVALPTNQRLYGVSFADANSGIAVGDSGLVFRTTNAGFAWNFQTSGTIQSLYDVSHVSPTTAVASGWGGTVIRTTNGGSSWNSIGFNIYIRWGVSFTDPLNGVVVGDVNTITRTTDGGVNWTYPSSPNLQTNFHCVRFYNSTKGIAVGEWGAIFKTNDGGLTWEIVTKGIVDNQTSSGFVDRNSFFDVQCINPTSAVILRSNGIYLTSNNAQTWSLKTITGNIYLNGMHFMDLSTGTVVGKSINNDVIMKTTNAGTDWVTQHSSTSGKLNAVSFASVNNGVAVGAGGRILRTTNGGQDWILPTTTPGGYELYDVQLVTPSVGYAVGRYGRIIKTTNGGETWDSLMTNFFYNLNGVAFYDDEKGIVVGDSIKTGVSNGLILKTIDGGSTWSKQVLGSPLLFNDVTFTDSSNWYAVGISVGALPIHSRGRVFESTDAGINWSEQQFPIKTTRSILGVSAFNDSTLLAVGLEGMVLRTTNSGSPNSSVGNTVINLNLPVNHIQPANSTMSFNLPGDNPSNISSPQDVVSVEVTINEVLHARTGDLTFTLEHNGVKDTLIFEVGGNGADFISTVLNDNSSLAIENGTAPFTGYYKPSRPLNIFNGMNAYGDWTLSIIDNFAGNDGILNSWSLKITLDVLVNIEEENDKILTNYQLHQNYPNPFNPTTTINFSLPQTGIVNLKIYNLLGEEVITLIAEERQAGNHSVQFNASYLSSGIYFYKLQAGSFFQTKKMILLK